MSSISSCIAAEDFVFQDLGTAGPKPWLLEVNAGWHLVQHDNPQRPQLNGGAVGFRQVLIWPCSAMRDGTRQCALQRLASRPESIWELKLDLSLARTSFVRRCCHFKRLMRQGM